MNKEKIRKAVRGPITLGLLGTGVWQLWIHPLYGPGAFVFLAKILLMAVGVFGFIALMSWFWVDEE